LHEKAQNKMTRRLIFHPFLFAVFPVLALYGQNANQLRPKALLLPLIAVLVFCLAVWAALAKIGLGRERAAILSSFLMLLFFFYGHGVRAVRVLTGALFAGGWSPGATRIAIYTLWSAAFISGLLILRRTDRAWTGTTRLCTVLGICFVSVAFVKAMMGEIRQDHGPELKSSNQMPSVAPVRHIGSDRPDIFYFVLDGYARSDVLREIYGYDNTGFLKGIERRGFHVLHESRANYAQTELCIAATLNMDYLQNLVAGLDRSSDSRRLVDDLIVNNRVTAYLRERGYRIIAFRSGFDPSDLATADLFLTVPSQVPKAMNGLSADAWLARAWRLDAFQSALLESTPLPLFLPIIPAPGIKNLDPYEVQRQTILFPFATLPEVARYPGPKFVFAHVLAPHPPFVFGSHGEPLRPDRSFSLFDGSQFMASRDATAQEYVQGYIGQLRFINMKVTETLDRILTNSPRRPLIILRSDHGPGLHLDWDDSQKTDFRERLSNLSAYLLPGANALPYEGMSSVNTFRFIFNHYFDEHLPYQPDRSYFSNWARPYDFLDVTCKISSCEEASMPKKGEVVSKPLPRR
jgi:hypothetical protein